MKRKCFFFWLSVIVNVIAMNSDHKFLILQIQLKSLAEEMQAIIRGLEKVKQELAASKNDGPVSDIFRKVFSILDSSLYQVKSIIQCKESYVSKLNS